VNFFGHAVVACWVDRSPRVVLGSMLPDFASMCRSPLLGAEWHHATDEVFHVAPTFLELHHEGSDELEELGLSRGPATAIGHVGTELLLDGVLVDDDGATEPYLAAVAIAAEPAMGLRWHGDGAERYLSLWRRLSRFGLPDEYRDPTRVAGRLHQILGQRPRLAITEAQARAIVPWLERTRTTLVRRAPELLDEVRAGLAEHPRGAPCRDGS